MSFPNILLDEANLNLSHHIILLPMDDMFLKSIPSGVLNHSTLIKGLTKMIIHNDVENYYCFTELTLNNLVKYLYICIT